MRKTASALQRIARTAGDMFSSRPLSAIDQKEGHANFVTNIDREVESYLQESLLSLVSGSKMIGEEKENDALKAKSRSSAWSGSLTPGRCFTRRPERGQP